MSKKTTEPFVPTTQVHTFWVLGDNGCSRCGHDVEVFRIRIGDHPEIYRICERCKNATDGKVTHVKRHIQVWDSTPPVPVNKENENG